MAVLNVNSYGSNYDLTNVEENQKLGHLMQQLKKHDVYTFLHSMRVGELAFKFAKHLQLNDSESIKLLNLGIIHDVGKLKVPKKIIQKNGPLDEQEWTTVKNHVIYGKELLLDLVSPDVLDAVLHHHENIDGSGYLGLAGEQISLFSRIIRIADSFDAMTSDRQYQKSKTIKKAIHELQRFSKIHYDSLLVHEFINSIYIK